MPHKDPEARKQYLKEYRQSHKEFISGLNRDYREKHRNELIEYCRDWRYEKKKKAYGYLGNKCKCCGETEHEFLTYDHIHNNGGGGVGKRKDHHLKISKEIVHAFEKRSIRARVHILNKYQLLCWNCNVSKKHDGKCRHKREPISDEGVKKGTAYMRNILCKGKIYLGKICRCCEETEIEFLGIDHIDNDGYKGKRNKNGTRYAYSYYFEIIHAFERGTEEDRKEVMSKYQTLCHSCNFSKHIGNRSFSDARCAHVRYG